MSDIITNKNLGHGQGYGAWRKSVDVVAYSSVLLPSPPKEETFTRDVDILPIFVDMENEPQYIHF